MFNAELNDGKKRRRSITLFGVETDFKNKIKNNMNPSIRVVGFGCSITFSLFLSICCCCFLFCSLISMPIYRENEIVVFFFKSVVELLQIARTKLKQSLITHCGTISWTVDCLSHSCWWCSLSPFTAHTTVIQSQSWNKITELTKTNIRIHIYNGELMSVVKALFYV